MRRRSSLTPQRPATTPAARGGRRAGTPQVGLRPVSELPVKARLFLIVAGVAIVGFAAWVTIRLLDMNSEVLAILLIAFSYVGAVVVGIAVVTITRMLFSLGAVPYLLGRGVRRLLGGR